MKNTFISSLAVASALTCSIPVWGQQMAFDQLPQAVRQTASTETKNGAVKRVERMIKNGRPIYDITFQQPNGGEKNIYLEENGSYVQDSAAAPATTSRTAGRELTLKEVPDPVMREINTETSNGPVKRILQRPYNGRDIFEVAFQKSDGSEKLIYLNTDGSYVQDQPAVGGAASVGTQTGSSRAQLSAMQPVTLGEVPLAAQNAIRAQAGNVAIENINRGMLNGATVYEAAFPQGGRTVHLRVDERGNIIPDVADRMILSRAPLAGATIVTLSEVPAVVQNAIHAQIGNIVLDQVQKGIVNGRTAYQALYRSNGQLMQIRVNESGRVLQAPMAVNQP